MKFTFRKNNATMLCSWSNSRSNWSDMIDNILTNRKVYFYCNKHNKTTLSIEITDGFGYNKFSVRFVSEDYSLLINDRENPFGGIYREVFFRVSKKQGLSTLQKYLSDAIRLHIPHIDEYPDIEAVVIFTNTGRMNIDLAAGINEFEMRTGDKNNLINSAL